MAIDIMSEQIDKETEIIKVSFDLAGKPNNINPVFTVLMALPDIGIKIDTEIGCYQFNRKHADDVLKSLQSAPETKALLVTSDLHKYLNYLEETDPDVIQLQEQFNREEDANAD